MSLPRDFEGVWFPRELWLDRSLRWTEKIILREIISLDGPEGCFAGNGHFAGFSGLTERAVQDILSRLQVKGCITVDLPATVHKEGQRTIHALRAYGIKPVRYEEPSPLALVRHEETSERHEDDAESSTPEQINEQYNDRAGSPGGSRPARAYPKPEYAPPDDRTDTERELSKKAAAEMVASVQGKSSSERPTEDDVAARRTLLQGQAEELEAVRAGGSNE